jgi:hypothetical protein
MYAVDYDVYHHSQFILLGVQSIVCKGELILIDITWRFTYRIGIFVAMYCSVPPFRKANFCGVPSRATVKAGCAMG